MATSDPDETQDGLSKLSLEDAEILSPQQMLNEFEVVNICGQYYNTSAFSSRREIMLYVDLTDSPYFISFGDVRSSHGPVFQAAISTARLGVRDPHHIHPDDSVSKIMHHGSFVNIK
jgi:hypothetical protein